MGTVVQGKAAADPHGDLAPGEFVLGDGDGIPAERVKWMTFGCPKVPGRECMVAVAPQRAGNGASWRWDGNRIAPTLKPSINCNGAGGCGWHGHLRAGRFEEC